MLAVFFLCPRRITHHEKDRQASKAGEVGYVYMEGSASADELWKADNLGQLVTLDFSSLSPNSYTNGGGFSGTKFGDVSAIFRKNGQCSGNNELRKILVRKLQNTDSNTGKDTVFLSEWEILIVTDFGKGLLHFNYGPDRISPLIIDPEHCTYRNDQKFERFLEGAHSILCGYLVLKESGYDDGEHYCKWCHTLDSLSPADIPLQGAHCSSVVVESRFLAIIPVGYRYQ